MALQQKTFADLITFTRSSAAGRFNERGIYETVPANQPRFDFDPVTLQPLGLLIEETRTNLMVGSGDYTLHLNAGTGESLSVTPNAGDGPRGPATMTRVTRTGLGVRYLSRTFAGTNVGDTITVSQMAKASTGGWMALRLSTTYANRADFSFNLTTGESSVQTYGDITLASAKMVNLGSGVWRCEATAKSGSVAWASLALSPQERATGIDSSHTVLSEVFLDCTQVEIGAFSTSYIPTQASQVTRTSDSALVNNLSPWYNSKEGTFYVDYTPGAIGQGLTCVGLYASSANPTQDIVAIRNGVGQGNIQGIVIALSALNSPERQARPLSAVGVPIGSNVRSAMTVKRDEVSMSTNGGPVATDNTVDMPNPTQMGIGKATSNQQYANGHIRAVRYYPFKLTDAELQALTK